MFHTSSLSELRASPHYITIEKQKSAFADALEIERKNAASNMLLTFTLFLGGQIFFTTFFIDALNEGDNLFKAIGLYGIMLII